MLESDQLYRPSSFGYHPPISGQPPTDHASAVEDVTAQRMDEEEEEHIDKAESPQPVLYKPKVYRHLNTFNTPDITVTPKTDKEQEVIDSERVSDNPQPVLYKPKTFGYVNTYTPADNAHPEVGPSQDVPRVSNRLDTSLKVTEDDSSKPKTKRKRSRSKSKSVEKLVDPSNNVAEKIGHKTDSVDNAKVSSSQDISTFVQDTVSTSTVELTPQQTVEVAIIPAKKERMTPRKVKRKKRSKSSDNILDDAPDNLSKSLPDLGDNNGSESGNEKLSKSAGASEEDLSTRKLKPKKKRRSSSQGEQESKSVSSLDPNLATPPLARSSGVMETEIDDLFANDGEPEYVTAQQVRGKKAEQQKEKIKDKVGESWKSLPSLLKYETDIDAVLAAVSTESFDKTINSHVTGAMDTLDKSAVSKKKKKKKASSAKDALSKSLPLLGDEESQKTPLDMVVQETDLPDELTQEKKTKKSKKKAKTSGEKSGMHPSTFKTGEDSVLEQRGVEDASDIKPTTDTSSKPKKKKKPKELTGAHALAEVNTPLYNTAEELTSTPIGSISDRDIADQHIPVQTVAIPLEINDPLEVERMDFTEEIRTTSVATNPVEDSATKKKKGKKKKSDSSVKTSLTNCESIIMTDSGIQPPFGLNAMETDIDGDITASQASDNVLSADLTVPESVHTGEATADKPKKKKKHLKSEKAADPDENQFQNLNGDKDSIKEKNVSELSQEVQQTMETDIDGDLNTNTVDSGVISGLVSGDFPVDTIPGPLEAAVTQDLRTDDNGPQAVQTDTHEFVSLDLMGNVPSSTSSGLPVNDVIVTNEEGLLTDDILKPAETVVAVQENLPKEKRKKKSKSSGQDDNDVSKGVKVKKRSSGEKKKKSSKSTPCLLEEVERQDRVTLDDLRLIETKGRNFHGDSPNSETADDNQTLQKTEGDVDDLLDHVLDHENAGAPLAKVKKPKKDKSEKTKKSKRKEKQPVSESLPFMDSPDSQNTFTGPNTFQTVESQVLVPSSGSGHLEGDQSHGELMTEPIPNVQSQPTSTDTNIMDLIEDDSQVFADKSASNLETPGKVKKRKKKLKSEGDAIDGETIPVLNEESEVIGETKKKKLKESKGKTKKKVVEELGTSDQIAATLKDGSEELVEAGKEALEKPRKKKKSSTEKKKKSSKSTPCLMEEVEMEGRLNFSELMPKMTSEPTVIVNQTELNTEQDIGPAEIVNASVVPWPENGNPVVLPEEMSVPVSKIKEKAKKKRKEGSERKKKSSKSTPCLIEEFNSDNIPDFIDVQKRLQEVGDLEVKPGKPTINGEDSMPLPVENDELPSHGQSSVSHMTSPDSVSAAGLVSEKAKKKRKSSTERKKKSSKSTPSLIDELDNEAKLDLSEIIPKTYKPKSEDMETFEMFNGFSSGMPENVVIETSSIIQESHDVKGHIVDTMDVENKENGVDMKDVRDTVQTVKTTAKDHGKEKKKRKGSTERKKKSSKSTPCLVEEQVQENKFDFEDLIPRSAAGTETKSSDRVDTSEVTLPSMPDHASLAVDSNKIEKVGTVELMEEGVQAKEKVKKRRKSAERKKKSSKSTPNLLEELDSKNEFVFRDIISENAKPTNEEATSPNVRDSFDIMRPQSIGDPTSVEPSLQIVPMTDEGHLKPEKVKKKRTKSAERKKKSSKSTPSLLGDLISEDRIDFGADSFQKGVEPDTSPVLDKPVDHSESLPVETNIDTKARGKKVKSPKVKKAKKEKHELSASLPYIAGSEQFERPLLPLDGLDTLKKKKKKSKTWSPSEAGAATPQPKAEDPDVLIGSIVESNNTDQEYKVNTPVSDALRDKKLDDVFEEMERLILDSGDSESVAKRSKKKTKSTTEIFENIIPKKPRSPDKSSVSDLFVAEQVPLSTPQILTSQEQATVMTPDRYSAFSKSENLIQTSTPYRGDEPQVEDGDNSLQNAKEYGVTDVIGAEAKQEHLAMDDAVDSKKAKKRSKSGSKSKPEGEHVKKKKKSRSTENILDVLDPDTKAHGSQVTDRAKDNRNDNNDLLDNEHLDGNFESSIPSGQGLLSPNSGHLLDIPFDEITNTQVSQGTIDTSLPSQNAEFDGQVLTSTPQRLNSSTVEDILDLSRDEGKHAVLNGNQDEQMIETAQLQQPLLIDIDEKDPIKNSVETDSVAGAPVETVKTGDSVIESEGQIKKVKKKKKGETGSDVNGTPSKKSKKKSKTSKTNVESGIDTVTADSQLSEFATQYKGEGQSHPDETEPMDATGLPNMVPVNEVKPDTELSQSDYCTQQPDVLLDLVKTSSVLKDKEPVLLDEAGGDVSESPELPEDSISTNYIQTTEILPTVVEKPPICENEIETVTDEPDLKIFDQAPAVPPSSNRLSIGDSILERSLFMEQPEDENDEANFLDNDNDGSEDKSGSLKAKDIESNILTEYDAEGTSTLDVDHIGTDVPTETLPDKRSERPKKKKKEKPKETVKSDMEGVQNAENIPSENNPNFGEISTDLIIEEIERKPRKTKSKGKMSKSMENILQDVNSNRIVEEFLQNQTIDIVNMNQSKSFDVDHVDESQLGQVDVPQPKKKKKKIKSEKKPSPEDDRSDQVVDEKKPIKKAKEKMTPRQIKKKDKQKKLERQLSGGGGADDNRSVASTGSAESGPQVESPTSTDMGDVWKPQPMMERSFAASEVSFHTGVSSIHDIGNVSQEMMDLDDLVPKGKPGSDLAQREDHINNLLLKKVEDIESKEMDDLVHKNESESEKEKVDEVLPEAKVEYEEPDIVSAVPEDEAEETVMEELFSNVVPKRKTKEKNKKDKDSGKVKKKKKTEKKGKKIKDKTDKTDTSSKTEPEIVTMVPEQKPNEKVWEFLGQKLSDVCENLLQETKEAESLPGDQLLNDSFQYTDSGESEEQYTEIKSVVSGDFLDESDEYLTDSDDLNRSVDLLGSTEYLNDLDSNKRTKSVVNLTKKYTGERDVEKAKSAIDLTQHSLSSGNYIEKKVDNTFNKNASRSFNILCPDTSENIPYADSSDDSQVESSSREKEMSEEFQSPLRSNAELRQRQLIGVARLAKSRPNIYSLSSTRSSTNTTGSNLKSHSKSLGDVSKLSKPNKPVSGYDWRPIVRSHHKKNESTPDAKVKSGILKLSTSITKTVDTQRIITESHRSSSNDQMTNANVLSEKSNEVVERMTVVENSTPLQAVSMNRSVTSAPKANLPEAEVYETGEILTFKVTPEHKKPEDEKSKLKGHFAIERYIHDIIESSMQLYREEISREKLADRAANNVINDIESSVINILNEGDSHRPSVPIETGREMSVIKANLARELAATAGSDKQRTMELEEDHAEKVEEESEDESSDESDSSSESDDSGFLIQGISVMNDDDISALFACKMQRLDNLTKGIDTSLDHIKEQESLSEDDDDDDDDDDSPDQDAEPGEELMYVVKRNEKLNSKYIDINESRLSTY